MQQSQPPYIPFPDQSRALQALFAFHTLTIRQKLLAIAQKYHVHDEFDRPRFFVVRPPKIALNIVAGAARIVVDLIFILLAFSLMLRSQEYLLGAILLIVGPKIGALVSLLMSPFRDIGIYTDESERFPVLRVEQMNKFGWHLRYLIRDVNGVPVAEARKHVITALWRRRWEAITFDGRPICAVQEDSLVLALLRRYLGPMYGLLRTNFDILLPDGTRIGEYNRKLTLTDQYILNLPGDPYYLVDRRVVLTLAILLDTAEGR